MAYVRVDGDSREALERALKKFSQRVNKEGTLKELRRRDHYLSPSQKRRLKKEEARKRFMKNQKKRNTRDVAGQDAKFVPRAPSQSGSGRG